MALEDKKPRPWKGHFRKELGHLGKAVGDVIRGPKIPQKSDETTRYQKEIPKKRRGVLDTLFGPAPKKESAKSQQKRGSAFIGGKHTGYITKQEYRQYLRKNYFKYYKHEGPQSFDSIWKKAEKVIPFGQQGFFKHERGGLKRVKLHYQLEIPKTRDQAKRKQLQAELKIVEDLIKETER